MDITRETIESFLFHEADLLDEFAVEEWLALWTPDACYWVPCNGRAGGDPTREVSLIYDDYARLQDRVWRLASPAAHSQRPRSRMRRVVGNIRFELREGELHTRSNFLLAELRRGRQEIWSGVCQHRLLASGDNFQIKAKTVLLTQSDEAIDNLSFLL
ncbi:MAG: aromatic-ring-hydroxylating dioxygenase subunit beta [Immundisolibacter sp.]|uniref:aromatic-ring-hydroxylating dioxygenase subunit beta n=1 Tax=Immundisolibacter sp. TaxID=1934948 RepID=UPI003568E481